MAANVGMRKAIEAAAVAVPTKGLTEAFHIGHDDAPFLDVGDGSRLKLLHVDLTGGLWVIRREYPAGYSGETHYHTGTVFAFTQSGAWYYREYPDHVCRAGSYLFEPAHSVHSIVVPAENTEVTDVWFAISGANVNIDDQGRVTGIVDGQKILEVYRAMCDAQGLAHDRVLVSGLPG